MDIRLGAKLLDPLSHLTILKIHNFEKDNLYGSSQLVGLNPFKVIGNIRYLYYNS